MILWNIACSGMGNSQFLLRYWEHRNPSKRNLFKCVSSSRSVELRKLNAFFFLRTIKIFGKQWLRQADLLYRQLWFGCVMCQAHQKWRRAVLDGNIPQLRSIRSLRMLLPGRNTEPPENRPSRSRKETGEEEEASWRGSLSFADFSVIQLTQRPSWDGTAFLDAWPRGRCGGWCGGPQRGKRRLAWGAEHRLQLELPATPFSMSLD